MTEFYNCCFVCGKKVDPQTKEKNKLINLPICEDCKGTEKEKKSIDEHLEGMADGFVCGCI